MPTGIEWCDETFNPWWGCERVSPGCAHCYADTMAKRVGHGDLWPRGKSSAHGFRFPSEAYWQHPLKWARTLPEELGRRPRIFCASMADVFEERPALDASRLRLMMLIEETPELDWLVLTKRPEFARDWLTRWYDAVERGNFPAGARAQRPYPNMWIGVSIENARYTWRADVLRDTPAAVRFISAEPLLGSLFDAGSRARPNGELDAPRELTATRPDSLQEDVDASDRVRDRAPLDLSSIDWIIVGGESGPRARPFHLEHAREIVRKVLRGRHCARCGEPTDRDACDDCVRCGSSFVHAPTAVFVKQLGAKPMGRTMVFEAVGETAIAGRWGSARMRLQDRKGGDWDEWPDDLRIREFPRTCA